MTGKDHNWGRGLPGARGVLALAALSIAAAVVFMTFTMDRPARVQPPAAPASPSAVCNTSVLRSPYHYSGTAGTWIASGNPAGLPTFGAPGTDFPSMTKVVVVPTGDNTAAGSGGNYEDDHTIFYFEPGVHRITSGMYTGHDSVYVGGYTSAAGGAVIDGVDGATNGTDRGGSYLASSKASSGNRTNNTWLYLTIRNYTSSVNNAVMGNVNGGGSAIGDTYKFNTIGPNQYGYRGDDTPPGRGQSSGGGYAINMGDDTTVQFNCLIENAQGAFNGSGDNINISGNEISRNGLGLYPDIPGPGGNPYSCGCSGGGKLNFTTNATITHNYVHDNYNAGIWLDFNNTGADISFNYVKSNWATGIVYEASYNANITYNTLVDNGWSSNGTWPAGTGGAACYGNVSCTGGLGPVTGSGGGNPFSAIYLPNSGGNKNLDVVQRVDGSATHTRYRGRILVKGNVLIDNFGGVDVYVDTDRYPGGLNYDSACSVPFNGMAPIYYRQTRVLLANSSTIKGASVLIAGGAHTLCSFYGTQSRQDGYRENVARAPAAGMGVYDLGTGTFLGKVASASSPKSFTLDRPSTKVKRGDLLISAYGGCGPADYFGAAPGRTSGQPPAFYWDNCMWGSRGVVVTENTFTMHADRVTGCTVSNRCGYMMARAFKAGVPKLSRYFYPYADLVANASDGLGNVWSNNVYGWSGGGPAQWRFQAGSQGHDVTRGEWQDAPYGQDHRSTFRTG